jgi:hypothetical protein
MNYGFAGYAHVMNLSERDLLALPFWEMHYALYDDSSVIVNGNHYRIGKSTSFKGYGGHKFTIKFFDGRVVETNNLWSQGTIDSEWRDRLPDNAEFVGKPFGTH